MDKTSAPAFVARPLTDRTAGLPVYGVNDPDYGLASGEENPTNIPGVSAIGVARAASAQHKLRGLLQGLSAGAGGLFAGKAMMPKDGEPDWPTILAALGGAGLGWVGSGKLLDYVGVGKNKKEENRENSENEKYGGVLEEKRAASSALPQLLLAKMYSDRKHYLRKHAILRQLISKSPNDFVIDSEQPDGIVGLTHSPTQFRIHMPGRMLPTDVVVPRLKTDPIEKAANRLIGALFGRSGAAQKLPIVPKPPIPVPPAPAVSRTLSARARDATLGAGKAVVKAPVNFMKNWAGFGQGGNLQGVGLLNRTGSPVSIPSTLGRLNPLNRVGTRAMRSLDDMGRAGHVTATALRAGKNILTSNPVRPLLQTFSPRLGRHANKLTYGGLGAYGGYRGARVAPDRVEADLRSAGVTDEDAINRQWWRVMKAQPKLLHQTLAPASMGGDDTPIGRAPFRFVKNTVMMLPKPKMVGVEIKRPKIDKATDLFTRSPSKFVPTPANLAKQTVIGNVMHNLGEGAPDVAYETAKQVGVDVLHNPEAVFDSPILKTLAETAEPALWNNPDSRRALLTSVVGPQGADYLMRAGPYAMPAINKAREHRPPTRELAGSAAEKTLSSADAVRKVTDRVGVTDLATLKADEAGRQLYHKAFEKPPEGP